MEKPQILIIENSIDVTGALKSIIRTANDLKDYFDFQFVIPTGSRGRSKIERKGFANIIELPMKEISKRFNSVLLYIPYLLINTYRLNRIVSQHRISLIHVNDLYNLLPVAIRLFGNTTPYVCHIRFLPNKFPKFLFNFWLKIHLKYAHKVIAVSDSVLKQLSPHPKLVLIHNELPEEERYPELTLPLARKHYTFLYLSNFMIGKGQNYALEAFARVHQQLTNWKLRFVGGDMGLQKNKLYRNQLQHQAKLLGIDEKIEWVEFTEEVEKEYKLADIILNFSESESFSITCLEALYFGRPLIATDCGGPAEIIDHQESGLLVNNRDIRAMADAMLVLAEDEALRRKVSAEGAKRSREKFSLKRTSHRLLDIYNSLLT